MIKTESKQKFSTIEEVKKAIEEHGPYAVIVTDFGKRLCVAEAIDGKSKLRMTSDDIGIFFDYLLISENRKDIPGKVTCMLFSQIDSIESLNTEEAEWVFKYLKEEKIRLDRESSRVNTFIGQVMSKRAEAGLDGR